MTTVQTVIDRGFAKSAAARPDSMAAPNELVARIGQCLSEAFSVMARENPYVIAAEESVAFNGVGWPRPSDTARVIKVVTNAGTVSDPALLPGTEINIVPYNDQRFCEGLPSLTELGQVFRATGQTMDPSAGDVTIVYARGPVLPLVVTESIDPLFPALHDDFLQFDLAAYLAAKDKRAEDQATFLAGKNAQLALLVEWTKSQTFSLQQRFPLITPPLANDDGGRQQPARGG